jgi:hypothetical protein
VGLIPDGDNEIYYSLNPSGRTTPLREMSTRGISWGGGLTTLARLCADCLEILGTPTSGTLKACPGL